MERRDIFIAFLLMLSTVSFVACSKASTSATQLLVGGPGGVGGQLLYFQLLMSNPAGVFKPAPQCSQIGGTCDALAPVGATGCCGDLVCASAVNERINAVLLGGFCCVGEGYSCQTTADCCSGTCGGTCNSLPSKRTP